MSEVVNIAAALTEMAARQPDTPAIFFPHSTDRRGRVAYTHYTYRQLDHESDVLACGLTHLGVGRGVRTALMVTPSLEFFALTFALFKAGAVPVLIDPGIGLKNLKTCLAEAEPAAFIGVPKAHVARLLFGWGRRTLEHLITVGETRLWGGRLLREAEALGRAEVSRWSMAPTQATETAAILFTSGSTGVPKGVVYQHRHFVAQVDLIRDTYGIRPGEIDLPTFPLFALFDPALGMTTVVPDMDFTRPASVDPRKLINAVHDFGVTNMFGSPALLDTVGRYGAPRGEKLPTLKRVISAGAPVPAAVMERFLTMLDPEAEVFTPYGATESLPVCSIGSREILGDTRQRTEAGEGVCVGRPVAPNEVSVIRISDEPVEHWSPALLAPPGEVGEIVVRGPTVTESYHNRPGSTALAKIRDGDAIRHRMGDLGRFDADGRLWFCGRKAHRVPLDDGTTLFTVPCEGVFNTHPRVYRTALVGVRKEGRLRPVLCVELEKGATGDAALTDELLALGATRPHTAVIRDVLYHPGFPVDIRHNAKIGYEALAKWAEGRL